MASDRRRISIACEPCRQGKRKCDGAQPACNLCRRRSKPCRYGTRSAQSSSRGKHTEDNLRSEITRLKSVVESLAQQASSRRAAPDADSSKAPNISSPAVDGPLQSHGLNWMSNAAREISQLTRRRVKPGGVGSTSIYLLEPDSDLDPALPADWDVIPAWPSRMHDSAFRQAAFECFSKRINRFECLIDDEYVSQLTPSLDQPYYMLVLVLAIIAASTVITREHHIGAGCVQCAERMITRACVSPQATLVVARALTVLVWRELTVGGNPTRTWMFNCMAAALFQQLGVFDWSVETIEREQHQDDFRERLKVFWSFSAVDRICATLLGRMSSIPWRHNIQIPRYAMIIGPEVLVTVEKLYFDHLWNLWRFHSYYMHATYSPGFDLMPDDQRQKLRLEYQAGLMSLKESTHPRLKLSKDEIGAHPFLYYLQMAFDATPITLNLPFLGGSSSEQTQCLQEMVHAASSHTNVLFRYRKVYKLVDAPPAVVYYTVRAATIHLLLATSTDLTVQRRSWRRLKICLDSLEEIQKMWERQAGRAIRYIQGLAARWGVTKALPLRFSQPLGFKLPNSSTGSMEYSGEAFDPALDCDALPAELDVGTLELEAIQWAIAQDNACQLMQGMEWNVLDPHH